MTSNLISRIESSFEFSRQEKAILFDALRLASETKGLSSLRFQIPQSIFCTTMVFRANTSSLHPSEALLNLHSGVPKMPKTLPTTPADRISMLDKLIGFSALALIASGARYD